MHVAKTCEESKIVGMKLLNLANRAFKRYPLFYCKWIVFTCCRTLLDSKQICLSNM